VFLFAVRDALIDFAQYMQSLKKRPSHFTILKHENSLNMRCKYSFCYSTTGTAKQATVFSCVEKRLKTNNNSNKSREKVFLYIAITFLVDFHAWL